MDEAAGSRDVLEDELDRERSSFLTLGEERIEGADKMTITFKVTVIRGNSKGVKQL